MKFANFNENHDLYFIRISLGLYNPICKEHIVKPQVQHIKAASNTHSSHFFKVQMFSIMERMILTNHKVCILGYNFFDAIFDLYFDFLFFCLQLFNCHFFHGLLFLLLNYLLLKLHLLHLLLNFLSIILAANPSQIYNFFFLYRHLFLWLRNFHRFL